MQYILTYLLASLGLGAVVAGLATFVRRIFGQWGLLVGWMLAAGGLAIVLWPHAVDAPLHSGGGQRDVLLLSSLLCVTLGAATAVERAARREPPPSAPRHVMLGIGGFYVGLLAALLLNLAALEVIDRVVRRRSSSARGSPDAASRVADDSGAGRRVASERPAPNSADTTLHPDGWGPIRIGMTRAQVVASLGEDRHPEAVGGPDPARCDEFRPRRAPPGMLVMIERGVLTRITLTAAADVRTDAGVRVGDSSAAVEAVHGHRLTSTPHYYLAAPARYLRVWQTPPPAEGARGIVYEIDTKDRVSRIHAGAHSITRVEGCV